MAAPPHQITDDLPLAVGILVNLKILHTTVTEQLVGNVDVEGLVEPDIYVLIHLNRPRRMGALATELLLLPSTMTAVADRLEARGFIERQRAEDDRRAWNLVLTPQGEALQQKLFSEAQRHVAAISGLDEAETQHFAELFAKIRRNIVDSGLIKGLNL